MLVAQSCLILCDPVDYNLSGSFVHGILQAWILEWVAISFSRGSSQPRDQIPVSWTAGRFFTIWATREAPFNCTSIKDTFFYSYIWKLFEKSYFIKLFVLFFKNWTIVDLQYYVSFMCTAKWLDYIYRYIYLCFLILFHYRLL